MATPIKILIVEDEMIIAANIAMQLGNLGYEISAIVPRGEDALQHLKENKPDVILLDINLKGKLDGIETARLMQKTDDIPLIYLTANADDAHFERAKDTKPYAFISKPFKKTDLQRAIELTVNLVMNGEERTSNASPYVLTDRIFVKDHEKMLKIIIEDIFYIEADRNYCRIFCHDREYLLVMTLKDMENKLPPEHFVRIHRSYIVNISQIDEVATAHVVISKKALPMSKLMRDNVLKRLQTI